MQRHDGDDARHGVQLRQLDAVDEPLAAVDLDLGITYFHYPGETVPSNGIDYWETALRAETKLTDTIRAAGTGPAPNTQALLMLMPQRAMASSSVARASTQRAPSGVCSFFQKGAWVLR